jgi:hypothetical protein
LDSNPLHLEIIERRNPRVVTRLRTAPRIRYALMNRRGIDLVAVMVPEDVIDDPLQCANAIARAYLVFHIPAVLVSFLRNRLHGTADTVAMLNGVDVARLPWRLYTLAR